METRAGLGMMEEDSDSEPDIQLFAEQKEQMQEPVQRARQGNEAPVQVDVEQQQTEARLHRRTERTRRPPAWNTAHKGYNKHN